MARRPDPDLHGVLVVDKPAGPTSHDIVDRVRRALGVRRVGHTGTLDPFATGVLPICVGKATRLARFLAEGDKVYEATVRLGFATTTDDVEGAPLADPRPVPGSREAVEQAC
ncbi:MAG TPA: tRNA pseudouridine(55) synthase TruB, partial [Vicinamibacteria bacterium]